MNKVKSLVLSLVDIEKEYRQGKASSLEVLKSINLEISKGELIAIVGASGCGKSTLLHIAGLLDTPSKGRVEFASNIKSHTELRLHSVGFIYQYHYLLPDFSARENVAMPQIIAGVSKAQALAKADMLLGRVGLSQKTHNMPGELSGGQQQRVAIARSLANDPEIIIADEPTGNLDPDTAEEIFKLFADLAREKSTAVLMATHNLELARRMDRMYRLDHGRLGVL